MFQLWNVNCVHAMAQGPVIKTVRVMEILLRDWIERYVDEKWYNAVWLGKCAL